MESSENTYQVAIVGGGPVGLFLACLLHQAGIKCGVFEKRAEPITHSRSIGIHPVSLELFKKIEVADTFISAGIKVKKGLVFSNADPIGALSFQSCPPPFPFILTLPQFKTEQLLEAHLNNLNSSILHRNAGVKGIDECNNHIQLEINHDGNKHPITADYVVGCDGKDSFIRRAAAISFTGKTYNDTYIMGDFTDNTPYGNAAAIFLCTDGLIESFPLSKSIRRWVVKTDHYIRDVKRSDIESQIAKRIGHDLRNAKNIMLSSFGVQKQFAEVMAKKRIILAGDAAHVISPIGGQGMNLGWLDAYDLAMVFKEIFSSQSNHQKKFQSYSKRRAKIAHKAARRADFNMAMGRETNLQFLKKTMLKCMLTAPLSHFMARLFTMRGLNMRFF